MANNCDYCHKPLSLMRRLRGEQFCSLEHLDAYSAQQAEFALERLAASVSDTPNTARTPLPKPAPKLRPAAPQPETLVEPPAISATVAVEEREEREEPEEAQNPQEPEPDYPMAPYLAQSSIPVREPDAAESRRNGIAPLETWSDNAGWSMPPFRSEPSDPRTWNAGKLAAQIPPAAGFRELLAAKAPGEEVNSGEVHSQGTLIQDRTAFLEGQPSVPRPDSIPHEIALAKNHFPTAEPVPTNIRLQASSFEWQQVSDPQFFPAPVVQGEVPFSTTAPPSLLLAEAQRSTPQMREISAGGTVEAETSLNPGVPNLTLPQPLGKSWDQSITAGRVAMPDFQPVRLYDAAPVGTATWQEAQTTVNGPSPTWSPAHLGFIGPVFGWESSPIQQIPLNGVTPQETTPVPSAPSLLNFHVRVRTGITFAPPQILGNWAVLRTNTMEFESGPLNPTLTATGIRWQPLPFRVARIDASARIAPPVAALRSVVRLVKPPEEAPARPAVRQPIAQSGPVKYSPVAIVVLPPPQFALLPAALTDEQRYVAQVPNGVWRLPRVRHTGYRALGPFPKLPLRMPDEYLRTPAPVMAPATEDLRLPGAHTLQDLSGVPTFPAPDSVRIHPADYFVWPRPKGLKVGRMNPERITPVSQTPSIKRFGPGRAEFLQDHGRNADGLAKG